MEEAAVEAGVVMEEGGKGGLSASTSVSYPMVGEEDGGEVGEGGGGEEAQTDGEDGSDGALHWIAPEIFIEEGGREGGREGEARVSATQISGQYQPEEAGEVSAQAPVSNENQINDNNASVRREGGREGGREGICGQNPTNVL